MEENMKFWVKKVNFGGKSGKFWKEIVEILGLKSGIFGKMDFKDWKTEFLGGNNGILGEKGGNSVNLWGEK